MRHVVHGQNEVQRRDHEFTSLGINGSIVKIVNDVGDALYRAIPINHMV